MRNELIAEAHRAILSETFAAKDSNQLCGLLIDALAIAARDDVVPRQLYDLLMKESGAADRERAVAALRAGLEPDQLYAFFKDEYKVDPDLDRAAMTKTLGRATRVTGQMLSHVANEANLPNKPAVWLARMGSGITALLELAVPTRVWGDIGRRLLAFCVFIGLFLALTGWIAANDPIEHYGVLIAIATVTVSLAAYILGDFVSRRGRWRMVLRGASAVLAAILIGFAIIGVLHAGDASRTALHWLQLQTGPAASAIASSAAP